MIHLQFFFWIVWSTLETHIFNQTWWTWSHCWEECYICIYLGTRFNNSSTDLALLLRHHLMYYFVLMTTFKALQSWLSRSPFLATSGPGWSIPDSPCIFCYEEWEGVRDNALSPSTISVGVARSIKRAIHEIKKTSSSTYPSGSWQMTWSVVVQYTVSYLQ